MIEKIIDTYLLVTYGCKINNTDNIKRIIYYLLDNEYEYDFILKYLLTYGPCLDDSLWDNSILKPNTFYYHNSLTIMPGASIWNPNMKEKAPKFYLEMKIDFTIDDLLNYYYHELLIPIELRNYDKDKGAFEHLLKTYNNKFKVEAIDFILFLIDYNKKEKSYITNVFDLQKHERETYDKVNYIVENSIHKDIIWRY